jgi:hypothetical protein
MAEDRAAVEGDDGGSFLQTTAGAAMSKLSATVQMSDFDRDVLSSFLSSDDKTEYVPQSGQITSNLKQR